MGCGISQNIYQKITYLLENFEGNLLLDADALNSISKYGVDVLKSHKCNLIITPHLKEFERLSNISLEEIKKDYIKVAKDFANKYNLIINLKNDVSVITDGKEVFINTNGNAGLAKGGSGDLLSGITLGLLNSKKDVLKRVAAASFILGRSAEIKVNDVNEYSLIARDVSSAIIDVINEISKK
jgi:NAD(P)H-hydrate epimerase